MADTNLVYPYELLGGQRAVASEVMADFEAVQLFAQGINATINEFKEAITDLKNKPTREMFDIYYSVTGEAPAGAYPLWTGETITNCKTLYPQFWKKLNVLANNNQVATVADNAAYEAKLEEFGQCGAFFIDTLNGHVRLPKITRFISSIESLSDIGEYNDGIPDHGHNLRATPSAGDRSATTSNYLGSGETTSKASRTWSDNFSLQNKTAVTPASTSNSKYGAAEEVQPKHVRLYLYLQVANNIAEISELDVNAIVEQMNEALEALETEYNKYSLALKQEYQNIKDDLLQSSTAVKDDFYYIASVAWEEYQGIPLVVGYPFRAFIDDGDIKAGMFAAVAFSAEQAVTGNFAPVTETVDGGIYVFAKTNPGIDIWVSYIAQ